MYKISEVLSRKVKSLLFYVYTSFNSFSLLVVDSWKLIWYTLSRNYICYACLQTKIAAHGSAVPHITVPQRMVKRMERLRAKEQATKRKLWNHSRLGKLAIACGRPQFNHYVGQRYSDLTIKCLASGGWKHPKSKSDYFTINAIQSVSTLCSVDGTAGFHLTLLFIYLLLSFCLSNFVLQII